MREAHREWIIPDWPCPPTVRAFITTRSGGVSIGTYQSLNLGDAVGDRPENVTENRRRLAASLPGEPKWLKQVHGTTVVDANTVNYACAADASVARSIDTVCVVTVADCIPVLFCDRRGHAVAAAHAGWRGLCAGVLENTVRALGVPPAEVLSYLGPGIGPEAFEVGDDVYQAFVTRDPEAKSAFRAIGAGYWLANLFFLACQRLHSIGVTAIYGGKDCTVSDPDRFFSHRRDKISGRMAALVWLTEP
jgi:YfiH family protein